MASLLLISAAALAQTPLSSIVISASVPGARFQVDGQDYTQPATFVWPKGSKHILAIPPSAVTSTTILAGNVTCPELVNNTNPNVQYDAFCRTRYTFSAWSDNAGLLGSGSSLTQIVTADPTVTSYTAKFTVEYKISLSLFDLGPNAPPADGACSQALGPRPAMAGAGVAFVDGVCFKYSANLWMSAGPHTLNAFPYDGFVFKGFTYDASPTTAYLSNFTVVGPGLLAPIFEPAKRVRIVTAPLGFKVSVDKDVVPSFDASEFVTTYPIPGNFDFALGSVHTLGAPTPQLDRSSKYWVFDSWSNGGGQDMQYVVKDTNIPETLTANFILGAHASFETVPKGLKLKIDDRDWPSYTFTWGIGKPHSVSAQDEQIDSRGRKYIFRSWSNGGAATQSVALDASGLRLIATYEALPRVVIQSSAPGVPIKVDGVDCMTPCSIDRAPGAQVQLSAADLIKVGDSSRLEFIGWGDASRPERSVTFNQDFQTVMANYRVANRLVALVDPEIGANLRLEPASGDGFYSSETQVNITADTKPGYRFRRWDGDLSGTVKSGTISMSSPRVVRALLEKVPVIASGGVRNAAGGAAEAGGVAPGSLISIYGGSLASRYEVGPVNPMAQSVGDVAVQLNNRYLPIIFVSPDQINAQLPSDLEPGSYTLTVKAAGLPEVSAPVTVVRNAPGLFSNAVDEKSYALALHEDGSPITLASPARRSETITLLGTGFGPYDRPVFDGFTVMPAPAVKLTDPADLIGGGFPFQPSFMGAAPGFAGVAAAKFRIPKELPGAASVEMRIRVNGAESNVVILPIE
ncbi:MAG TPA: hypothetical protein VMZ52_09945 [Bryobacteraceae bacterium]|nr:hypothetical protein [Bryobacteraceae bacterium]